MMTLDDAWGWYHKTRFMLKSFGRLGMSHWDSLPSESSLWKDDRFKELNSATIVEDSKLCLEPLDDFAVLILFSVFESSVRERVLAEVQRERALLSHHILTGIVDDAMQGIENGSFFRVLEVFKARDADMVEEVNQVRRYRNWVAHGRSTARPNNAVDPETAYVRLRRFLDRLSETDQGPAGV